MPSRKVLVVLVALATVLTVAAGAALASDGNDERPTDGPTIAVTGSGEIDAEPDAAIVHVTVTARGDDAASVRDEVAAGAAELRDALQEFGLDEDDVQTQRYTIHEHPRSRDMPNETVFVGEQTFEVTYSDVDRVGELIDAAVAGGADDVGGVHFTLSEERRDELRDQALRMAVDDARSEAAVIADATGLSITGVHRASAQESAVHPYRAEMADVALEGGDAATEIDPRDVTVTATVDVTFAATG